MGEFGTGKGGRASGTPENQRPTYSKNQLAEMFGVSFSTMAGWCGMCSPTGEGPHGSLYDSRDVFRVAAQTIKARYEAGDREKELVRKCRAEADMKKLQLAERRGELVPVEAIIKILQNIFADLKARFMPMGAKFSDVVFGINSSELVKVQKQTKEEIQHIEIILSSGKPISEDSIRVVLNFLNVVLELRIFKNMAEVEAVVNAFRDELLEEIRRIQPRQFLAGVEDFGTRDWGDTGADETADQADGKPVGGPKKNVKPRKRGRPRKVEH